MSDEPEVTAQEIADWIDRENISVRASSQCGYKSWSVCYLDGSTDSWLLFHDSGMSYMEAMRKSYLRWQADPGGVQARQRQKEMDERVAVEMARSGWRR